MTQLEPSRAPTGSAQAWRAVAEIALFAAAATVLLTGPNISVFGRALARFPAPSISQSRAARPRQPAAAPTAQAPVKKPGVRSTIQPAVSATAPAKNRAPSRRKAAGPAPVVAEAPAPATGPAAELSRLQHFYGLMDAGIALYQKGWYGPALARFRQAAGVMPDSPYAHLWWGRAAVAAGRPDEAWEPLERAIALAPGTEVARKAQALLQTLPQQQN